MTQATSAIDQRQRRALPAREQKECKGEGGERQGDGGIAEIGDEIPETRHGTVP